MPVLCARQISVTAGDRRRLTKLASSRTAPHQQVIRARIVLAAECGLSNNAISRRLGISVDTVRCWRGRYGDHGLAGLADRPRSGRPPCLSPCRSPRSRRWPVSCRPRPGCRCRGGAARSWPTKSSAAASCRRSRPRPAPGTAWPIAGRYRPSWNRSAARRSGQQSSTTQRAKRKRPALVSGALRWGVAYRYPRCQVGHLNVVSGGRGAVGVEADGFTEGRTGRLERWRRMRSSSGGCGRGVRRRGPLLSRTPISAASPATSTQLPPAPLLRRLFRQVVCGKSLACLMCLRWLPSGRSVRLVRP